jgi:hypothetical protein
MLNGVLQEVENAIFFVTRYSCVENVRSNESTKKIVTKKKDTN